MTCYAGLYQQVALLLSCGLAIAVGPWMLVKLAASGGRRFALSFVLGWGLASVVVVLAVLGALAARAERSGGLECAWSDLIANLWYMSLAGLVISALVAVGVQRRTRGKGE